MTLKTIFLAAALMAGAVQAQTVEVKDAWVRTSVQGQKATGAFMKLTARDGARLVSASSPVAGVTEVHEMKMEGDVMKMRARPGPACGQDRRAQARWLSRHADGPQGCAPEGQHRAADAGVQGCEGCREPGGAEGAGGGVTDGGRAQALKVSWILCRTVLVLAPSNSASARRLA